MFRLLPVYGSDPRVTAEIVNGIMNGKTNNTGRVTLAVDAATTTTIANERISRDSVIILVPETASASTTVVYVSAQSSGSATISHAANSTAGITYGYVIVG